MRPFFAHIGILSVLIMLGVALLAMEALSPQAIGGLIKKFTFSKLYWMGFILYSLISTVIVLGVGFFHKIKKKAFTAKAVILSHVIPIGLVWIFISFGFHDMIQDAWQNKTKPFRPIQKPIQDEQKERQRLPIPPTPLPKHLKYKTSDIPVEPDTQKSQ